MSGERSIGNGANLKAPFPYFGGKSRVAYLVWPRFGDVKNYVEPFCGSCAMLLKRPHWPFLDTRIETVNDIDILLANFWRAVKHESEVVAQWADEPVNEADLHARHRWLVDTIADHRQKMKTDPDYYDVKRAGWWVWGMSTWIAGGWCAKTMDDSDTGQELPQSIPHVSGAGQGINAIALHQKRPQLTSSSGVNANLPEAVHLKQSRPQLTSSMGIHSVGLPHLSDGETGVNRIGISDKVDPLSQSMPRMSNAGVNRFSIIAAHGDVCRARLEALIMYFHKIQDRLRFVRVVCGNWDRVLGPAVTYTLGMTGVFLDPPYAVDDRDSVYTEDSFKIAHEVRQWCLENGDNPLLRIALCGYEGEHEMPGTWEKVSWKAQGGFGAQRKGGKNENPWRERIWFSPHCLPVRRDRQLDIFAQAQNDDGF